MFLPCRAARRLARSWRSAGMRTPMRGECSPTVVPSDGRPRRGRQADRSKPPSAFVASRSRSSSDKMRPLFVFTGIASPSRNQRRTCGASAWRGSGGGPRSPARQRRLPEGRRGRQAQEHDQILVSRVQIRREERTGTVLDDIPCPVGADPVFRGRGRELDCHLTHGIMSDTNTASSV